MATDKVKLIRITEGLYRTEDFNYAVGFISKLGVDPAHWTVRYTNGFNEKVRKEFRTLAECRKFLQEYY